MCAIELNTSYEPFSQEPEYIEANREFIRSLDLASATGVLDLACGTGTCAELMLEVRPTLAVVGLDLSRESLLIAEQHLEGRARIALLQGTADELPLRSGSVDAVIMGNAIHMLPDEDKLLAEVRRVLRSGGLFAFNSSFFAGTFPEGTERFHHEWIKQAILYLDRLDREWRAQGRGPIPRKRGTVRRAFSRPWPSPEEWVARLDRHAFRVQGLKQRTVMMTQRSFETIGAYAGFAEVILSGYPVRVASEALQAAAAPAFAEVNMNLVPRYWLEVVATRN